MIPVVSFLVCACASECARMQEQREQRLLLKVDHTRILLLDQCEKGLAQYQALKDSSISPKDALDPMQATITKLHAAIEKAKVCFIFVLVDLYCLMVESVLVSISASNPNIWSARLF